jgi:hypothetical protein
VKTNQEKKLLTLGDLITTGYLLCGKRRAVGIIRLAAEARLIWFKGKARFTIS